MRKRYDRSVHASHHAALFIDYENLYELLRKRLGSGEPPEQYIREMIDALRRYVSHELRARPTSLVAYADFSICGNDAQFIQRTLFMQGVEPRFVPATLGEQATLTQLTVEATELAHARSEVDVVVVLTGDRAPLPLVQHLHRLGRTPVVAYVDNPLYGEGLDYVDTRFLLDALDLVDEATRRRLLGGSPRAARPGAPDQGPEAPDLETTPLDDEALIRTLELIEEHFGQYDEVYLTPLLRKLSESFDENEHDPKTIVSDLEAAGAVWLEKRRGFPHDYTVLLVNGDHPDVQSVRDRYEEGGEDDYDDFEEDYDDDYDDDFEGDGESLDATYADEDAGWEDEAETETK